MALQTYEFFDHTADIGIRAQAKTLSGLFVHLAQGLTELLIEESRIEPTAERAIDLSAADAEALLLGWLQELLVWFSTDRFVPVDYALTEVTPTRLRGRVRGGIFDPAHDLHGREVKAITRHLLEVRQSVGGWHGQVLVDI